MLPPRKVSSSAPSGTLHTACLQHGHHVYTRLSVCLCLSKRENGSCGWEKEPEVFSSAIICRFPYSLFPLCLAHIRRTNSTPLAIPGVLKSRPHSQGKALGAHGGELQTDILQITTYHTSTSQIRWPTSSHFSVWFATWGFVSPQWSEFTHHKAWPVRSGVQQWLEEELKSRWW